MITLFTAFVMAGCNNEKANNNLNADAKKAADLACRIKQAEKAAEAGDISALDEDLKLSEQLTLIKAKYKDDKLTFLEAMDKEMVNCNITEIDKTEEVTIEDVDINSSEENLTADNEDFDKMLTDYETFTDEYVILYKKALNGDNSAFETYPELMEKAEKLQKSLEKADKNKQLSISQIKRIAKIQAKMLKGISGK